MDLTARHPRTGELLSTVKFMVQTLAAAGELQRDFQQELTCDGLRAAEAKGSKGGRRPAITAATAAAVRAGYPGGRSIAGLARDHHFSRGPIRMAVADLMPEHTDDRQDTPAPETAVTLERVTPVQLPQQAHHARVPAHRPCGRSGLAQTALRDASGSSFSSFSRGGSGLTLRYRPGRARSGLTVWYWVARVERMAVSAPSSYGGRGSTVAAVVRGAPSCAVGRSVVMSASAPRLPCLGTSRCRVDLRRKIDPIPRISRCGRSGVRTDRCCLCREVGFRSDGGRCEKLHWRGQPGRAERRPGLPRDVTRCQ